MSYVMLYVTASDRIEAERIAKTLVEERLIACANLHEGMMSFYWWEGRVQSESEASFLAKTKKNLVSRITKRIKELHSYSCPCVVAIPIQGGNQEFLDWIESETV